MKLSVLVIELQLLYTNYLLFIVDIRISKQSTTMQSHCYLFSFGIKVIILRLITTLN